MAKPDDYLARVERMNRGPLQTRKEIEADVAEVRRKLRRLRGEGRGDSPAGAIIHRRDIPHSRVPVREWVPPHGAPVNLTEAVEGIEIIAPSGGRAFLVEKAVGKLHETGARVGEQLRERLERDDSNLRRRLCMLAESSELSLSDVIFLDVETAGLTSAPLFLIGTMAWEGGGLVVRQYFARDYAEERAVTSLFVEDVRRKGMLVSFNGKSFDWPFVRTRAAANGIGCPVSPAHFDLLHESRRIWREVLPDCRLQTLEQAICGRMRQCDIPGSMIPEAYHYYVRTQNAAQIVQILEHNLSDLVTLGDLMARLPVRE
jgi:uncharacterized protein YprB with RNaseH-like and TPR domain